MNGILISRLIKDFRRKTGISQTEFGKLVGVSGNAVSKWEREICYPDMTSLPYLAKILDVGINDMFEKKSEP